MLRLLQPFEACVTMSGSTLRPIKPPRLRLGDAVAIVSPSWGGPATHPAVYEAGLHVLRTDLGLSVVEMPHARTSAEELYARPDLRAADIRQAFADPSIRGVISSIGGDDSIRVLPHLDVDALARTPKVVMGFSDTATLLTTLHRAGLVTFNGPSVMAGLAQARRLPRRFLEHLRAVLFEGRAEAYTPYGAYHVGYPDWASTEDPTALNSLQPDLDGFRVLQGTAAARGRLFGGCVEVIDFLRGTRYFPEAEFFEGRVLFLETSEEKPTPRAVGRVLRSFGIAGVLDRLSALLLGRAHGYSPEEKAMLERIVLDVVSVEFGRTTMPIVANMDFGHTDPQFVLPLGVEVEVDPVHSTVRMLEPAVE